MARATQQEQKGSTGASEVTGKFTRIGWGFAEIARHDNGIDLFLMARDERLFDLGLTLGAQVKAGPSYFAEPSRNAQGEILGWWFRDTDGEHLSDLASHGLPQLLVLYELDTQVAYWVHVKASAIESTGKGSKILVPISNTVDEAHREALLQIAAATRPQPSWEGSAWGGAPELAGRDLLRHALIAPRLVAPHPNSGRQAPVTPAQAIAMLMQARLSELTYLAREHSRVPDIDEAATSRDWTWRFFGALGHRLRTGELDQVASLIADAPDAATRTAATVAAAAGLLEEDRPDEAVIMLVAALELDDAGPVDHAWLTVQHARALAEIGRSQEARDAAVSAQGLRRLHPEDVTAAAIEGVAAQLLFRITDFGSSDVSSAVRGADTAVAWWRQQARGQGLGAVLERTYRAWAPDDTVRWAASDVANDQLLAAALTATMAGDHRDWRYTSGLLGRDQLVRLTSRSDQEDARSGITTLRLAGAHEALKEGTVRLVSNGPALAVRAAASEIKLETSTATTARTNLDLLRYGGPVLATGTADMASRWILATLTDPSTFVRRTNPSFHLPLRLLDTLSGVLLAASDTVHAEVVESFLSQRTTDDQGIANSWSRVIRKINVGSWTVEQAERAGQRARSDHWELLYPLLGVAAIHDPSVRVELLTDIRGGSLTALAAFGDVRVLDEEVVAIAVAKAAELVGITITQAHSGAFSVSIVDAGDVLALLNLWHPAQSDWASLLTMLEDPQVSGDDKYSALERLAHQADQIPEVHRSGLAAIAQVIATQEPSITARLMGNRRDAAGPAALLRAALGANAEEHANLSLALGSGNVQRRVWVARLAGQRSTAEDVGLLAVLISDPDPSVRAAASAALFRVVNSGSDSVLAKAALLRAAEDPGLAVPMTMANVLAASASITPAVADVREKLASHPLQPVRNRATLSGTSAS